MGWVGKYVLASCGIKFQITRDKLEKICKEAALLALQQIDWLHTLLIRCYVFRGQGKFEEAFRVSLFAAQNAWSTVLHMPQNCEISAKCSLQRKSNNIKVISFISTRWFALLLSQKFRGKCAYRIPFRFLWFSGFGSQRKMHQASIQFPSSVSCRTTVGHDALRLCGCMLSGEKIERCFISLCSLTS